MKEAEIFESWANRIVEGTWALPETPEQQDELKMLMSQPLVAGADGMNATEQLYGLVGDDELFDIIGDIAVDPDANIWDDERVQNRLEELGVYMVTPAEPAVAAPAAEAPPVAENGPYDLPGKDYDRPGDVKRKQPSGEHNPYPFSKEEDDDYFREIFRKNKAKEQGMSEGAPEIGSKLPKSDVETFGIQKGRGYEIQKPKDWKPGDTRLRAVQQLIPTQDKKDHIRSRLGKHVKPAHLPEQGMAEGGDADRYYDKQEPGWRDTPDEWADKQEVEQGMSEGDNLATFEQAQCNQTMEGESCPEHGMAECGNYGMYESELARIKSLAQLR